MNKLDIKDNWQPDPEMVKASLEEYKKGNYLTTEEFLQEIRAKIAEST